MNDTQMMRNIENFGSPYPLPGTPCKKCGRAWIDHEHRKEDDGFDRNICPDKDEDVEI